MNPYVIPGLKINLNASVPNVLKLELLIDCLLKYSKKTHTPPLSWEDIQGKSRKREIVLLRHMYCYMCTKYRLLPTLVSIGKTIGNRDHTSVMHADSRMKDLLDAKDSAVTDIYNFLNNHF
jgi:hypothetical protein